MRLALDAMGGDAAPQAMVAGAVGYASRTPEHQVILVGQEPAIRDALHALGNKAAQLDNLVIEHAPEVIAMGDKISALRERPDDSMNVCTRMVKQGKADATVLCGNTACSVAAAQLHLRRIPGVKRAGILTPLPTLTGQTWVIDCGANAVGKPEHLVQFAEMAAAFLQRFEGRQRPRIGVLNIGSEESKGDDLTTDTLDRLRESDLNVLGNVEGNDIYKGVVDIVVCDGFTGNVVLKTSEGIASTIGKILKQEIQQSLLAKIGALLMRGAFRRLKERTSWTKVGGCLLLGVDGVTIIGHGRSDATAVTNALDTAARCVDSGIVEHLRQQKAPASQVA